MKYNIVNAKKIGVTSSQAAGGIGISTRPLLRTGNRVTEDAL